MPEIWLLTLHIPLYIDNFCFSTFSHNVMHFTLIYIVGMAGALCGLYLRWSL